MKDGVSVAYPDGALSYDALEYLDAFYAIKEIDLSSNDDSKVNVSLTRPFAQVNLVADKTELETAKATKVEFKIKVATQFDLDGSPSDATQEKTFTFTSNDNFKSNEVFNENNVYLGTTYLFVPSSGQLKATLTLYDSEDNILKGPSSVEITVEKNKRTNLVFSGIVPAAPEWEEEEVKIPDLTDGWIHITRPEQLAALLLTGTSSETKVHLCNDIDMSGMPEELRAQIAGKSFSNLILDGGKYEGHVIGGTLIGDGRNVIKKYKGSAFLATASGIKLKNITFDNVTIESTAQHVGVVVNTLSGENTFTNVTIQNSSATTTSGAAGGMVGYVVRSKQVNSPTAAQIAEIRGESLSVTIDGCTVKSTTAAGSLAEGKFVGLLSGYDNAEQLVFTSCTTENASVTDWTSPYIEGNQGAWLASNNYSSYDGWLGDEVYYRGKVYFGGTDEATNRFCPKWDGEKSVEPLVESNIKLIYSAFDVAKLQKSSHSAVTFKTDVDLGGYKFDPIKSITNLDGENNTIYNLKVDMVHDGTGAAFIQSASGTTTHKDIIFVGADIKNVHNPNIPAPNYGNTNDGGAGNAYAGTLVSHSGGTYTVSNVHVKNGKVYAVCKMGGLVGYVGSTSFTMTDCSVDGYTVENYEPGIPNYYTLPSGYMDIYLQQFQDNTLTNAALAGAGIRKIPEYGRVNMLQWWYTQGEAGGLIGFVKSPKAVIDGCSVTNTTINCTGQPDKPVVANVWDSKDFDISNPYVSGKPIFARGNTDIAGRHVNQFIGDVVSARASEDGTDYDVTISNYTVSCNKYGNTDASSVNTYNHDYASGKYCEVVGCAYYVGVDVGLDISIVGYITLKHVNDYAGKLTFYPVGGEATKVVLEEPSGSGNNPTWTGGSFTDMKYEQGRDKIGGSWYNPTYGPWYYKTLSVYPTYP